MKARGGALKPDSVMIEELCFAFQYVEPVIISTLQAYGRRGRVHTFSVDTQSLQGS